MVIKVFVLGRPGSGKSDASRYIADLARSNGWLVSRISDYNILYKMFQADTKHEKFLSTENDGFKVTDLSVLDTALFMLDTVLSALDAALQTVEWKVQHQSLYVQKLIIIEFARSDYCAAFKQFNPKFLKDAYFLYIETDVNTCVRRIHERTAYPKTPDDKFVADDVIKQYYGKDDRPHITSILPSTTVVTK